MKKKLLVILFAVIVCTCIFTLAANAIIYPADAEIETIYSDIGDVVLSLSGEYYYADEDIDTLAPDSTVWNYMWLSGVLDSYCYEDGYKIGYDEYIGLVDKTFTNHSDMKAYLKAEVSAENPRFVYDETTGEISWSAESATGTNGEWTVFKKFNGNGRYYYISGAYIEPIENNDIEGLRENYDYIVRNEENGVSYWKILDLTQLVLHYENYLWKVHSYDTIDGYVIDGILYNRIDNENGEGYTVSAHYSFLLPTDYGCSSYDCDLPLISFDGSNWYDYDNCAESYMFKPYIREGYEIVKVYMSNWQGARILTPNENGEYLFVPDGLTRIGIETKEIGEGVFVETTNSAENFAQAQLNYTAKYMANIVLTEDEMNAVNNEAATAKFYLEAYDVTDSVSEDVVSKITDAAGDGKIKAYFNIDFYKQINDAEPVAIRKTDSDVRIRLTIPEDMLPSEGAGFSYKMYSYNNGEVTEVPCEYDYSNEGTLKLSVDSFGITFAIVVDAECSDHVFGEWSVIEWPGDGLLGWSRRICNICNYSETVDFCTNEPGEEVTHESLRHYDAKEAKCHYDGNVEYWTCSRCDRYFYDDCTRSTFDRNDIILEAYGDYWDLELIPAVEATCTTSGNIDYWYCYDCGYIELPPGMYIGNPPFIPARGHLWGEWSVVSEPTRFADGEKCRACKRDGCGEIEYEVIPQLNFTISADNYNIVMTEAQIIDHIRYAPGVYNTSAELRASPGLKNFNAAVIAQNTVDGVFSKELKNAGLYTFWVRFTDGSVIMQQVDMTNMTQSVSSKYLELTVHDLYGVKEYYIAKGSYASYDELKDNYDIKVTAAEIAGAKDHTVLLGDSGYYTVCVKYDDPEREDLILNHRVSAIMPGFESNGLKLNISNLAMAKVIRVAPGEWSTAREVKIADGSRSFNQKWIQGAASYDLTFKEAGVYTVAVEYNYGLTVVRTVTIEQSEPTFVQDGNKVTFGNLDGLYVIRYAPGEFSYAGDIKRAAGARFLRPSAIDANGEISIEVGEGVYTFCVQYHDGSYNYYTVDNTKSLLERYGLTFKQSLMIDLMPTTDPENKNPSFYVGFESNDGSALPEIGVSAELSKDGIVQKADMFSYDGADFFTLSVTEKEEEILSILFNHELSEEESDALLAKLENHWTVDWDIIPLEVGEELCVTLTVTINGESETFTCKPVLRAVY